MSNKSKTTKSKTTETAGKPGAPLKSIKFPPNGKFTLAQVKKLNEGVCVLTIQNRIDRMVAGELEPNLVRLNETAKTGKVGRPCYLYVRAASYNAGKASAEKQTSKRKPAEATTEPQTTPTPEVAATPEVVPVVSVEPTPTAEVNPTPATEPVTTETVVA